MTIKQVLPTPTHVFKLDVLFINVNTGILTREQPRGQDPDRQSYRRHRHKTNTQETQSKKLEQ